jgi:hypothetical protein
MSVPAARPSGGAEFARWVAQTYYEHVGLSDLEGSQQYKKFLASVAAPELGGVRTGLARIQALHIVKFGYPLQSAGYKTAVFSARVQVPGTSLGVADYNYATVYWHDGHDPEQPEYVCLGLPFESRDGEYRGRFLQHARFEETYAGAEEDFAPVEAAALRAIEVDKLNLCVSFYPAGHETDKHKEFCENARLAIRLLAASTVFTVWRACIDPHVVESCRAVCQVFGELFKGAFGAWGDAQMPTYNALLHGRPDIRLRAWCGVKTTPLSVRAALNAGDINYGPWRELWCAWAASDLVVNGVAAGFPLISSSAILESGRAAFDNPNIRALYDRSARVESVLETLRSARSELAAGSGEVGALAQLDAQMLAAIEYGQSYAQLSDSVLCVIGEHAGMTPPSAAAHAAPKWMKSMNLPCGESPAAQAKLLFELCFAAAALHARAGVVHGDLHLNNVTYNPTGTSTPKAPSVVAYVAGPAGEADTYLFEQTQYAATIIDFSRSILGPECRKAIEAERGKAYAAGFYRGQASRVLRVFHHFVPGLATKYQEQLKGLVLARPDEVFRVLTAVDFLAVGRNFAAFYREQAAAGRCASDGAALAGRIEEAALEHLTSHLVALVSSRGPPGEIPRASDVIIPRVFAANRFAAWAAADAPAPTRPALLADVALADAYNLWAPLEYSGSDYERFPPWARFDRIKRFARDGFDLRSVTDGRSERPFIRAKENAPAALELMLERLRHLLDYDAPSAGEDMSWLDEAA